MGEAKLTTAADFERGPTWQSEPLKSLKRIGHEIRVRLQKLDQLGSKAVDQFDSISCLLKEAEGLCDADGFAAFKKTYCPELGQSRTYELLTVQEGRKTLAEIRTATRERVAKHRAAKKTVTESSSVTPPAAQSLLPQPKLRQGNVIAFDPEVSAEQRKAQYAAEEIHNAMSEPHCVMKSDLVLILRMLTELRDANGDLPDIVDVDYELYESLAEARTIISSLCLEASRNDTVSKMLDQKAAEERQRRTSAKAAKATSYEVAS